MNKNLLKEIKKNSILYGDFVLKSGIKSNYYVDKFSFLTKPNLLHQISKEIIKKINIYTEYISGIELGGALLATSVGLLTKKQSLIIRKSDKKYGSKKLIEGNLVVGHSSVLLEDVVTSGESIIYAADTLSNNGIKVLKIISIVDRDNGGREKIKELGYNYEYLFSIKDLLNV